MTLTTTTLLALIALQPLQYPPAPRGEVVEDINGMSVADPYRWLEADVRESESVKEWVDAENAITANWLEAVPQRAGIRDRLEEVWDYERAGLPVHRGSRWFQTRNSGLQNHSVLYEGQAADACDRVLLDPNTWSEDGTIALSGWSPSPKGRFLAWGQSSAGSDWDTWFVTDLETGEQFSDTLHWIKFGSPAWLADESGFYYTRFPKAEDEGHIAQTLNNQVWLHRIGSPQSEDTQVWFDAAFPKRYYGATVTEDGRWLVIEVSQGTSAGNALLYARANAADTPRWLIPSFDAKYSLIGSQGNTLFFLTDDGAAAGRIMAVEVGGKEVVWREVIAERKDILDGGDIVGGSIAVAWMQDAAAAATIHDLDGQERFRVQLPGLGSIGGFGGRDTDKTFYFSFSSYDTPPSILTCDLATGATSEWWRTSVPINTDDFEVRRVFVQSTDGARVPMFITARSGTVLDGSNPVLLYGYGGFDIAIRPGFSVTRSVWLELGGVLAVANIRGGSEYGRTWHEEGMFERKQQVFDDFIACGEWLIKEGWTSTNRLAIQGGSNGGLLVGACMTQRPDLFAAALPQVGVLDMLRFHLFTLGWGWTSEYGDPEDPKMTATLLAYSPYHNVHPGTAYPATMITTGDTDDRVVPAHSFKFAAALQHAQAGDAPILIRIETRAGHGAGTPTHLRLDKAADTLAFLSRVLWE
ncbi:MAG: prolyl oligopeptidase family serine peptidase [Phycisphaerales bacterium]|jgi:prolyl oligopeptidase|nr:prolyl oligopeptidase family serine peptidase [Phycisphaerales bacterium]